MANIGTTFTKSGKKAVLCGSGELGKEVALELQRYGVEVVALDKYPNAPAMHVAHRSHVLSMLDGETLKAVIEDEKPDYIIPEIEAIATDKLLELEQQGFNVIPTAKATSLTMNREGIRRLAAETLGLPTSPYRFAQTREEFDKAVYVYEKITPEHCSNYNMRWPSLYGHGASGQYEIVVTALFRKVFTEIGDYDKVWQYSVWATNDDGVWHSLRNIILQDEILR